MSARVRLAGNIVQLLAEAVKPKTRELLEDIKDDARRLCPVDTGHLKSTIEIEFTEPTRGFVTASAEYAGYVEFGTRHMAAQPFLRPAAERQRGAY